MNKLIVLDTNVLLTDPHVLLQYKDAEVIIPETVLGELDKLKTARVDADLRFRGREISRLIFELAEGQSLIDGVDLPEGGRLRVVPFEYNSQHLPDGFSTKSSDDKILATAYLTKLALGKDQALTLVTNDLNMLLKAQTFGIDVTQYGKGNDVSFSKRYLVRPFQKYRVPMTILGISIAMFAGVVYVSVTMGDFFGSNSTALTTDFKNLLTADQKDAYDNLLALQQKPTDENALQGLGRFYSNRTESSQLAGDRVSVINDAKIGIRYYERYLAYVPTDHDVRADMAKLYFYSGDTDRAIQEIGVVMATSPNHVNANYYLALFYWQGRQNLDAAIDQFDKVIKLTEKDSNAHGLYEQAKAFRDQLAAQQNPDNDSQPTTPADGETVQ